MQLQFRVMGNTLLPDDVSYYCPACTGFRLPATPEEKREMKLWEPCADCGDIGHRDDMVPVRKKSGRVWLCVKCLGPSGLPLSCGRSDRSQS